MRYGIKHKPTGKFLQEDMVIGTILVDEEEGFYNWYRKEDAEEILSSYYGDFIYDTDENEYPNNEFEVVEL